MGKKTKKRSSKAPELRPISDGEMSSRRRTGVRYTLEEINARIERRRKSRRVPIKQLCAVLEIDEGSYSRKVNLDRSSFRIDEISLIAEELAAPIGWPFIDEDLAQFFERCLAREKDEPAKPE